MARVGSGTGFDGDVPTKDGLTYREDKPESGSKETTSFQNASGPRLAKGNRSAPVRGGGGKK